MNRKKYGRQLSAIGVAAALTLMGVVQGMPQAHAAAITMDKAPSISYVDADGQPAKDASGNAITAPQLGYVLMTDPGKWTSADGSPVTFSYTWSKGTNSSCTTNMSSSDQVTGGSRTARNFVPLYSQIGQYLCVVVRASNGNDHLDSEKIPTSAPLVGFNPAMTALPTSLPAISTNLVGTSYKTKAWLTAYGWPDNSPAGPDIANSFRTASKYPNLSGTSSSFSNRGGGIHSGGHAGGDGSFEDPLTMAVVVNNADADTAQPSLIPWGTQIYVPRVEKYFIAEDVCYECTGDYGGQGTVDGSDGLGPILGAGGDGGPGMIHFDMWVGGQNDVFADVMACENQITISGMDNIIVNPASDLDVREGNIYHVADNGDKICNGEALVEAAGGLVGQYRSADPKEDYPDAGYATIAQWDPNGGAAEADAAHAKFANADLAWQIFDGTELTSTTLVRPDMQNVGVRPTGTLCITDPGNSAEAGTWLTLTECLKPDASEADLATQMVSYAGSFLVFNNMCFDASRDGKGNPDIGSISWDGQTYDDRNANSETISPGIRPITLRKCNYGTSDQWQVNPDGSITDMQTGAWTLGNMGPSDDGNTYLWAIPMEAVDEAAYANSFWSDPQTRDGSDSAPVAVDVPDPLVAGGDVIVTVSGLTTPTFQLQLMTKADPAGGAILLDNIPVPLQASGASSGTWTGPVTLPSNLKPGSWFQISAVALTDVVPHMEITGALTAVDDPSDLQTNPSGRWTMKNFADPPVPVTISIQGVSGKVHLTKATGTYTSTGGQVTGGMVPWIVLAGMVSIAGVLMLVRRQAIKVGVRQ